LLSAIIGATGISGHVVDAQGAPVANARVFLENGIADAVVETRSAADGAWQFEGPISVGAGVIAIADGYSFGGVSVRHDVADAVVTLSPPVTLNGTVVDQKGKPIANARVTRIGLLSGSKVGIPLGKLRQVGIAEPVSDEHGRFQITNLPQGAIVALKVGHGEYAQEAVENISVDTPDLRVTLYNGVRVGGQVISRASNQPAEGVDVMVRNAQPPHDTALCSSGRLGNFSLWLKPGVYMYQAVAPGLRSPGWGRLIVDPKTPPPDLKVYVSGKGVIRGDVKDAVSGKPIADAKLTLDTQGNMAAVARTGAHGAFSMSAMAGPNTIRIQPAPGYLTPDLSALQVILEEGNETVLPTFWLTPIPSYNVQVIDADENPALNAVVTVLHPQQFGWRTTDSNGNVKLMLGSLPSQDSVIGMVEDANQPRGALFALKSKDAAGALVKLFDLGTVRGTVVNAKGEPVEGAIVAGVMDGAGLPLWRTITGPDGAFEWNSVIPEIAATCAVYGADEVSGESPSFTVASGEAKVLGNIILPTEESGKSVKGQTIEWRKQRLMAGRLPSASQTTVLMYCSSSDAPMLVEGLSAAQKNLAGKATFAVVVDGAYSGQTNIPVLAGKAPGTATTLVLDNTGRVVLETFGMPPLHAPQTAGV